LASDSLKLEAGMKPTSLDFYTHQTTKLLRDFDRMMQKVKGPITARYGDERSAQMVASVREEYHRLLPTLPYVGGEQPFTQFVISSAWFLAFFKVMQANGEEVRDTGELAYLLSRTYLERVPGFAGRLLGNMSFSPGYLTKLRQRADESQKHPYPRGYIYSYVEGDGVNFDYGIDYHQCATWTLFQEHGATGLTPYLCACDYLYNEMLGWGLTRTTTLGEGGKVCDFRFKHGGPTRIRSTVMKLG
jgi:hypothetical protein